MLICFGMTLQFIAGNPAVAAAEEAPLHEDFNYTTGPYSSGSLLGSLWTVYNQNDSGVVEIKEESDGNKYLHLQNYNGSNKGKVSVYNTAPLAQQTGTVTMDLRVRRMVGVSATNSYPELRIFNSQSSFKTALASWDTNRPNAGVVAISQGFWTINNAYYSSTPQGNHKNSGALMEAGKWYNLTLVGNLSTKKYDFYVNGQLYQKNEDMREYSASGSTVDWFALLGLQILDTSSNADIDFDDLSIYSGQPIQNAAVSSITAAGSGGSIVLTYSESTKTYSASDITADSVNLTINPQAQSTNAKGINDSLPVTGVTVNSQAATKESDTSYTATVSLVEGDNTIPVTLTAADGQTTMTYFVKITKSLPSHTTPKAYYVSNSGDDSNPGTESQPWKTIERVNTETFIPGDSIFFKAGDVWEDVALIPKGSGSTEAAITIGKYGTGKRPYLKGNGITYDDPYFDANVKDNYKDASGTTQTAYLNQNVGNVIRLHNQQYWTIQDLEISNTVAGFTGTRDDSADGNGSKLRDLRGIHISGDNGQELTGFTLQRLYIHDVTGFVRWIGGNFAYPGIIGRGGWNVSKRTGGILMETMLGDGVHPTTFKDVTLQDSRLDNNSFGGFTIKQWSKESLTIGNGGTAQNDWAARSSNTPPTYFDSAWAPHQNIQVLNNTFDQGGSDYANDAVYITSARDVLVQGNTIRNPGVCGIELYYVDNGTIQLNEVWGSRQKAGGGDSNAIDPDGWTSDIIIQYNFIHDNGDGILFCGFAYNSVIARYNLIKDNSGIVLRDSTGDGLIQIYNNIIYQDKKTPSTFINSGGGNNDQWYIRNNEFYSTTPISSDKFTGSANFSYGTTNSNHFYNVTPPAKLGANYRSGDPLFAGAAPSGYDTLPNNGEHVAPNLDWTALKLQAGSPLISNGVVYGDMPAEINVQPNGLDVAGVQVGSPPSIGLFEFTFNGTLAGIVTNAYGEAVEGVAVTMKQGTDTYKSGVTNAEGRYEFTGVDNGTYTIIAEKIGYEGSSQAITITDSTGAVNLSVGALLDSNRTVTGTVSIRDGGPLDNATVTITKDGNVISSTTTNASGQYTLSAPVGEGYVLTVSKINYRSKDQQNVTVKAESGNVFDFVLRDDAYKVFFADDFNSYADGAFSGSDLWGVIGTSGNVLEIVQDPDDPSNKVLHMKRNTGSYFGVYNNAALGADGRFTINMRLKRGAGSSNQYALYSYIDSAFRTDGVPANPMATIVTNAGQIRTHNVRGSSNVVNAAPYTADTWYDVSNVVNLDTGTFDFYINGVKVLENQPLRTWNNTLDRLLIFASDGTGDFYVDGIKAYFGTPADAADQQAVLAAKGIIESGTYHIDAASDATQVQTWLTQTISGLDGLSSTGAVVGQVNVTSFQPAAAGSAGAFAFNVSLAKGSAAQTAAGQGTITALNVPDTEKPVITLIGDSTINLATGSVYSDAGATAADNHDGDLTGSIMTTIIYGGNVVPSISTVTEATYAVHYNVSDSAGNAALEVIRTIHVTVDPDTAKPEITLLGNPVVTVPNGTAYTDAGAIATDDRDGDITGLIVTTITYGGNVVDTINTVTGATYVYHYNVSDTAGNAALEVVRTVIVLPRNDSSTSDPQPETPSSPQTPVTSTPEPDTTPIQIVKADDLKVEKDGTISVALQEGKEAVLLPNNLSSVINDNRLLLSKNNLTVEFSSQLLNDIQKSQAGEVQIKFSITPASKDAITTQINQGTAGNSTKIALAGELYDLSLHVVAADGSEVKVSTLSEPIVLTFKVDPKANPDLLGVYYIAPDGKLEYMGGTLANGFISAKIPHLSPYAVLEYNKVFTDVNDTFWAHDVIKVMAAKHIIEGVSETQYNPQAQVTRAEFSAMIARTLGLEVTGNLQPAFADVDANAWYGGVVAAVSKAGIVQGRDAQTFAPNAAITREEMAVMIVRAYEVMKGKKASAEPSSSFSDGEQIQAWAQSSVSAAQALGLVSGRESNAFAPQDFMSRAESAQILFNLLQK